MIREVDGVWCVETPHSGYYLAARGALVEHLHYGARVAPTLEAMRARVDVAMGTDVIYDENTDPALSLLHLGLEISPLDKGDFRVPALMMRGADGSGVHDLCLDSIDVLDAAPGASGLPRVHGVGETLRVRTVAASGAMVERFYTPLDDCDAIVTRTRVTNGGDGPLTLERVMSQQLDLPTQGWDVVSFTGAWAREMTPIRRPIGAGAVALGSRSGVSSHYCNPFVMVCEADAGETHGAVYGFNLLWSGSHATVVEAGPYSSTRIVTGIQPEDFAWTLGPGESFDTPEAVLAWSDAGFDGLSAQMHALVLSHVVPEQWARSPRPVLVNNWEATYFDFTEKKLDALAGAAADVGAELFVLDDGWFGRRSDDSRGLGDFNVNRRRLPHGLDGLARRLSARGLQFGLWVEPEMVSEDSALFEAHPDWILASPGVAPSKGRHQWVLDLSRTDVQDHLIGALTQLVGSAPIGYVKWDMNRHHTDRWGADLVEQGRLDTAWTLGLYRVIDAVVGAYPDVLFESCASGGNRVDLGMLAHMPQVWLSDDTDAWERVRIQTGASFGYPQSVWGSHVSAVPNHQTLRVSPLEARFDVAAFGLLGYELDLSALSPAERRAVAAQIAFYRKHRELLQYGRWHRLRSPFESEECAWMVVAQDQSAAAVMEMVGRVTPNSHEEPLVLRGLNPVLRYRVTTRVESLDPRVFGSLMNEALPMKVNPDGTLVRAVTRHRLLATETFSVEAAGDLLMSVGLRLPQRFTGTGWAGGMRAMPDYSARIHVLERV